jgi:hypothetical protein
MITSNKQRLAYDVLKIVCGVIVGFFIGLGYLLNEQVEDKNTIVLVLALSSVITGVATFIIGAPLLRIVAVFTAPFWVKK